MVHIYNGPLYIGDKFSVYSESYTLDSASAVLQASASEAENNSEDLAYTFVNGDITIGEFRKQFIPERTNAHSLKLKAEKIAMQSMQQATQATGIHQNAYNQGAHSQYSNLPHRNAPPPPVRNSNQPYASFPAYPPQTGF